MRHSAKFIALATVAALLLSPAIVSAERSWTGPYAGGTLGIGISNGSIEDKDCWFCSSDSFSETFFQAGAHAGYNKQITNAVIGGEADLTYGSQHHTGQIDRGANSLSGTSASDDSSLTWTLAALGRVGMAVQDSLIYLAGGPALAHIQGSVTPTKPATGYHYSQSYWEPGMKAAIGIDHFVNDKLSVRAQYSMLFVTDRVAQQAPNVTGSGHTDRIDWLNQQSAVSVGLDWHF